MAQRTQQDISPWKEHDHFLNRFSSENLNLENSMKTKRSTSNSYFYLDQTNVIKKVNYSTFEPVIVIPDLGGSKLPKQKNSQSLPKFQNKRVFDGLGEKNNMFKTNQFISLAKSYSKYEQNSSSPLKNSRPNCSTRQLKQRLSGIIKQYQNPSTVNDNRLTSNKSQMIKNKYETIQAKEKNIIFLYSPLSVYKKNPQQSPKKKINNHILDKLLSDWK